MKTPRQHVDKTDQSRDPYRTRLDEANKDFDDYLEAAREDLYTAHPSMSRSREASVSQPGTFVEPSAEGHLPGPDVPESRVIVKPRPSSQVSTARRARSPDAYPTEDSTPKSARAVSSPRAMPAEPAQKTQKVPSPPHAPPTEPRRVQHPLPDQLRNMPPMTAKARSAPAPPPVVATPRHIDPAEKARALAESIKREQARKEKEAFTTLRLLEKQCACSIPVNRLQDCHACDYCVLFDGVKPRDAYFVQIVDGLSCIAMHPAGASARAELLVVPPPPRNLDGKRDKKIKNALFQLEAVLVNNTTTSLHISLNDAFTEAFYQLQIDRLNAMAEHAAARGSLYKEAPPVNAPFPPRARDLVESQKKRILSGVVDQLIYGQSKVPADADGLTLFPAHVDDLRDAIWEKTPVLNVARVAADVDEDAIRDYFGEETCFYFAWMNHYKRWLGAAGVLGLFVTLVGGSTQVRRDDGSQRDVLGSLDPSYNPFTLAFTMLIVVGSVLCVKMWERRCRTIAMRYEMYVPITKDEERHEFKGTPGTDPITGEPRRVYPAWKRALVLQPLSWLIIGFYMFAAFGVLLAFLNLDGLVPNADSFGAMPLLQCLSRRGGLFNKIDHPLIARIPTTAYSIVIAVLSARFRGLAEKLTDMENYRLRGDYVRALTQKRVVFELFNSYGKLFYIAFVRRSMAELSYHLKSIFFMGVFMRLFMGTLLPFILTHRTKLTTTAKQHHAAAKEKRQQKKAAAKGGAVATTVSDSDNDEDDPAKSGALQAAQPQHGGSSDSALDEADEKLEPYEVYSDYIEMAIQFGYITLFATVFPLASFIALLSNFVEVRSDLFKLCYVARRPIPRLGVEENEAWIGVMRLVASMAVITNTLLLFFTSSTMMHVFPQGYKMPLVTPNAAYALVSMSDVNASMVTLDSAMRHNGTNSTAATHGHNVNAFVSMSGDEGKASKVRNASARAPRAGPSSKPAQSQYVDVQRVQLADGADGQQLIVIAMITEHVVLGFATFLIWRISSFSHAVDVYLAKKAHERAAPKIKVD